MITKEKARRYDEALANAKYYHNAMEGDVCCVLEECFPELKESEDERIRKELIFYLQEEIPQCSIQEHADKMKEFIAWLEKQGENISLPKFTFDDVLALQCCMETVKKVQEDKELYEQLQSLHDRLHDAYWFEKQGEQKSVDKVEPKFKVGDWVVISTIKGDTIVQIASVEYFKDGNPYYITTEGRRFNNGTTAHLLPDKVEPKFKVGDWIVQENIGVYKVIEVCDAWYEVLDNKDEHYSIGFDEEYMCHSWTIADAKDGDVLVDVYGNIGICEQCDDFDWVSYCSLGCNGGFQHFKIEHENEKTYPATKEQRDILFAKIKEAGYKFDFEKNELKKINSQVLSNSSNIGKNVSTNWSEKYIKTLERIVCISDGIRHYNTVDNKQEKPYQSEIDFLKSLMHNKQWKPTEAQLVSLEIACDRNDRVLTQLLKDLKKRIKQ